MRFFPSAWISFSNTNPPPLGKTIPSGIENGPLIREASFNFTKVESKSLNVIQLDFFVDQSLHHAAG